MADLNPFDLLGDDDAEDPSQLVAKVAPAKKAQAPAAQKPQQPAKPSAKLPSKPLAPAEAVRETKTEPGRGGRGGGRGRGRGRGFDKENTNNGSTFGSREFSGGIATPEEADSGKPYERRGGGYGGPRGPFRSGRRGGFGDGDMSDGERPHRAFDRRSGTGRGSELKREGSGQANWGTQSDELAAITEDVNEVEKTQNVEKPSREEEETYAKKEPPSAEAEEKVEDKEMTLEEYEKVLEEKRKALLALKKTEERKVDSSEFESMQQISKKKNTEDIFIKLGSEKDKRKESSEKEEKAKKSVSITEFLKPAEGERYYGRGRGRGRGRGGGYRGGDAMNNMDNAPSISIEDPGQFPTLGGK